MAGCRMWECQVSTTEYDCLKEKTNGYNGASGDEEEGWQVLKKEYRRERKLKGSKSNGLAGYELYDNL